MRWAGGDCRLQNATIYWPTFHSYFTTTQTHSYTNTQHDTLQRSGQHLTIIYYIFLWTYQGIIAVMHCSHCCSVILWLLVLFITQSPQCYKVSYRLRTNHETSELYCSESSIKIVHLGMSHNRALLLIINGMICNQRYWPFADLGIAFLDLELYSHTISYLRPHSRK